MAAEDADAPAEEASGGEMTLLEHLAELRSRLLKSVIAVAVGAVVCWVLYDRILEFLVDPLCQVRPEGECRLVITDPLQGLSTRFRVAGYGGVVLAMPVLLWQVWRFITPGLYPRERRLAVPFVASALVLFALGAGLAYWTLPRALEFLIDIGGDLEPFLTPDRYIQLIVYMMLAFGIGFEFPILLVFLQLAGVLQNETLRRWRRYAIIGIVVLVAVITPSGDPISLLALSVPMYLFYEASILIGRIAARRRARARARVSDFTLDPFQEAAVAAVDAGRSVLVAAPTGAGKTVVAEHAVARTLERGTGRAFYTTPIKALSNQKFNDLVARHGPDSVGLLTGDSVVRGDAPVVVMTTEVLRNMIYAGRDLDDLEFVVLDEVHYLQDAYRGPVWEEVIVHLPDHVRLVCLSATVSNTDEVAAWLEAVRGATDVVLEHDRPVDLAHHYLVAERGQDDLHLLPVLVDGRPNPDGERYDSDRARGRRDHRRRGRHRYHTPRREEVVTRLARDGLLPAIYFIFSRAGCDDAGRRLTASGLRLVSKGERQRIAEIVDDHLEGISQEDLAALGHGPWRAGLDAGIAVHHAGLVPPFKEAVEQCFVEGLVKVVFATETLALGINMPARSVVVENLSKFTGETHEILTPGQYTQLTGRAGRRGIDDHGDAVVLWSPFVPFSRVAGLAASRRFELRSAFRPTYNMAANLVRRHDPDEAHRLLTLSFAQFQTDRELVRAERRLADRERALEEARARAECDRGDVGAHLDALERGPATRRHPPRGIIERGLARLKPGDVLFDPDGDRPLAVLSVAHRKRGAVRVRALTEGARVVTLHATDFDVEPTASDHLEVPTPYSPNNERFRDALADRLREAAPLATTRPGPEDGPPPSPVTECPDLDEHLDALRTARRLSSEIERMRRHLAAGSGSLAAEFDRVLDLMEERGHLDGWALTGPGQLLAGIYHESDLLVAEALHAGELDGLDAAGLAAVVSCITYEYRGPGEPPRTWFPSVELRRRHERLAERARSLEQAERSRRLGLTRPPEPAFAPVIHGWVQGGAVADVLADEDLSGGDFVRNARQVVDLLRQVAELAPSAATARAAREAVDRIERGVVAVASVLGG